MAARRGFRALVIVPPGCGKAAFLQQLKRKFATKLVSSGQLMRRHIDQQTTLGKRINHYLNHGKRVPDLLFSQMMRKTLLKIGNQGVILNGYPRSVAQAKDLQNIMALDFVLLMDIPEVKIVEHLKNNEQGLSRSPDPVLTYSRVAPSKAKIDVQVDDLLHRLKGFGIQMEPVIELFSRQKLLHRVPVKHLHQMGPFAECYVDQIWPRKRVNKFGRDWFYGLSG